MAAQSITEDSIKAALADRLKAIHVEVQDMSGMDVRVSFFCRDVMGRPGPCDAGDLSGVGRCRAMMVL